jgi:LytS/YehU family sensor histidine kinase
MLLPYVVLPDRYGYTLGLPELVIKTSYLLPVLLNSIVLIPRLLHKSRYWIYALLLLLIVFSTGLFEELVLENIFYPDTRGGDLSMGGVQHAAFKIGFVVGLFSSFKLLWDYQNKRKQVSELEKEKVESELKFLKSQINPHVLFNNLNNIYSYALEKSEKVPEMLLKLSGIMRYMLKDATEPLVPLRKELTYLENFVDLQKLRLEGRGQVHFQIEGDPGEHKIAPLLLVSFVENSFKHSMKTEVDDIIIDIFIDLHNDKLNFTARNSYSGALQTDSRDGTGIGLKNVRKRLDLIYEDRYTLNINRSKDQFVVQLNLKLRVDEPEVLSY